jgi:hypothetical protein
MRWRRRGRRKRRRRRRKRRRRWWWRNQIRYLVFFNNLAVRIINYYKRNIYIHLIDKLCSQKIFVFSFLTFTAPICMEVDHSYGLVLQILYGSMIIGKSEGNEFNMVEPR